MKLKIIPREPVYDDPLFSTPDSARLLELYADFYPKSGFNPPWVGYAIIQDDTVVGTCGFSGAPQDNTVELAYWTFEAYEGQGVASFACSELISIAHQEIPDINIIAHTAPEDNASTRILQKHGFIKTGMAEDDEIGTAWRWQLKTDHGSSQRMKQDL